MELQTPRAESVETGLEQIARAPGGFHARLDAVALTEVEFTTWTPDKRVAGLMRVAVAKTTEKHAACVGDTVAIGILEK